MDLYIPPHLRNQKFNQPSQHTTLSLNLNKRYNNTHYQLNKNNLTKMPLCNNKQIDNDEAYLNIYKFNKNYLHDIINKNISYDSLNYNIPTKTKKVYEDNIVYTTYTPKLKGNFNIDKDIFNFNVNISKLDSNKIKINYHPNENYYQIIINQNVYTTKNKLFVDIIENTIYINQSSTIQKHAEKITNSIKENVCQQTNSLKNQTPLMFAIYIGNYEYTKKLLNNIKILDKDANNVMYYYINSLNKKPEIKNLIYNFTRYPNYIY